jgi:hypothetical protein
MGDLSAQLARSSIPAAYHPAARDLVSEQAFTASDHVILTACVGGDELEQL